MAGIGTGSSGSIIKQIQKTGPYRWGGKQHQLIGVACSIIIMQGTGSWGLGGH